MLQRWQRFVSAASNPADLLSAANRAAAAGKHDDAVRILQECIACDPGNQTGLLTLIQIYGYLQRYELAVQFCARALQVGADRTAVDASLQQLLPALIHTEPPQGAVNVVDEVLAAAPDHLEARIARAQLLRRAGRSREAVQECQKVLELEPDLIPASDLMRSILADLNSAVDIADFGIPPESFQAYEWALARNVAETLQAVTKRFYADLGLGPAAASKPLMRALSTFQERLAAVKPNGAETAQSVLHRFELAWWQYRQGIFGQAIGEFEAIFRDRFLRTKCAFNPYALEAVVRSGEILARREELRGETDAAIDMYRQIIAICENGVCARRLTVLLARQGRLQEAADTACRAISSQMNLFPDTGNSEYIALLRATLNEMPSIETAVPGKDPS